MTTESHATTLPQLLLESIELNPDHPAVVFESGSLSMREFAACCSKVSAELKQHGVVVGDVVPVFMEPSLEMELGVWGTLFAGGAYNPISPTEKPESIRGVLDQSLAKSQAPVVLCHRKTEAQLRRLVPRQTNIVSISPDPSCNVVSEELNVNSSLTDGHPAYVIYTSGSTGTPKGVVIPHRSIVSQMRWLSSAYDIGEKTVILQKTISSFDAAQWEILSPACGASVVVGTPDIFKDVAELIRLIKLHNVNTLQCVPLLLSNLVRDVGFAECESLAKIFCGGGAFTRTLATQCHTVMPNCQIVNLYGPTECTINASAHTFAPEDPDFGEPSIPIGRPVANTHFYVLDKRLNPVEKGQDGELYISGMQVASGYLNNAELTQKSFLDNPFPEGGKLYKTGDLVRQNPDDTYQFLGRNDNQKKHRGNRIELEGIQARAEQHEWVKDAAVILREIPTSGEDWTQLVLFVELDAERATLMDGGGKHHASKASGTQFAFQMSNPGRRDFDEVERVIELEGKTPSVDQRKLAFSRKTYRHYQGNDVTSADIVALLSSEPPEHEADARRLDFATFGELLRYLGQFRSDNRLLPKYAYASPGALYATQLYLELGGVGFLEDGLYYYDPVLHNLRFVRALRHADNESIRLHFFGKKSAIEPIYKRNIDEVLEIETGHIVGLLEMLLPSYGLGISPGEVDPDVLADQLRVAAEDIYLGTFDLGEYEAMGRMVDTTVVYVQVHPNRVHGLEEGLYEYSDGSLDRISDELIRKQDVIALNQDVYEASSFGITVVANTDDASLAFVDLGRKLQKLMMNEVGIGFMSSGYSSKTGFDLPSAKRFDDILTGTGRKTSPSYFFVAGGVSQEQRDHDGLDEDAPLMKGPAEMLRDNLANVLSSTHVPDRVEIIDELPKTGSGKPDMKELESRIEPPPFVAPRTEVEKRMGNVWESVLQEKCFRVSVRDRFKEDMGGDSIAALSLLLEIEREFGLEKGALENKLAAELHTIENWAELIGERLSSSPTADDDSHRLTDLAHPRELYIWPGLGGTTMRLRELGSLVGSRNVRGLEAFGANLGEVPYRSIQDMAARDVKLIRKVQLSGPFSLWGYSFGARVAFECAYQLEQDGLEVDELVLIAPGSPRVPGSEAAPEQRKASFDSKDFVSMLYSVFAGGLDEPRWSTCLKQTSDQESFIDSILKLIPALRVQEEKVRQLVELVFVTYGMSFTSEELRERNIKAPITVFRTQGDWESFIDSEHIAATNIRFVELKSGHYEILHDPAIDELRDHINQLGLGGTK